MGISETYSHVLHDLADPRIEDWFLMSSPWPSLTLTALYLLIVWKGPQYMNNRQPFELRFVLIVYNFSLVVLSGYMFWEFFASSILDPTFSKICQPMDTSTSPSAMRLAAACWWFFFSKIIEFFDTFFFILRKKNSQISFLHVYHHSTMVLLWWIGVKYIPGGESYFSAMINCFIHALMYTYYLLSAFGPAVQKYLWWKRYMTSLQLIQFILIMVHTSVAMYIHCHFPIGFGYALVIYTCSHLVLFGNFYYKSYIKKKSGDSKGHVANGKKKL